MDKFLYWFDLLEGGVSFGESFGRKDVKFEEKEGVLEIKILVPGSNPEDIDLVLEDNVLKIGAKDSAWGNLNDHELYLTPDRYDGSRIEASLTKGILSVKLPVKDEKKPSKIEIKGE